MAFLFRRNTPAPPTNTHQSDVERLRSRQLASLQRVGGQAINHEQSIFDVPIYLQDKRVVYLRITLPDQFPLQPPSIITASQCRHAWIDEHMRVVGHSDLTAWNVHADVGKIVSDITAEFNRNPPDLGVNQTPAPPAYTQPLDSSNSKPPVPPPVETPVPPKPERRQTQAPAIPAVFPELEELSTSQLENLLQDKSALKSYVRKMDGVVNFLKLHDELVKGNAELAKSNLQYETEISELRSSIASLKTELSELQSNYSVKQQEQEAILSQFQPQALIERINQAANQADEQSEDLAYSFTNGEVNVSDFIPQYLKHRKLYHMRLAKINRFQSQ